MNLTGHILLAIGIATALLTHMFLNSMSNEGGYDGGGYSSPSSGYGDYRRNNYRSRRLIKKVLIIFTNLDPNHNLVASRQICKHETLHNHMGYYKWNIFVFKLSFCALKTSIYCLIAYSIAYASSILNYHQPVIIYSI